jgi:uncharacterized protein (TIGR03083 family)
MDIDEVWRTIDEQRGDLADFLDRLAPRQWETASLCDGWRVHDVAAHLTLAQMRAPAATVALLRARGSFHRMVADTARAQARRVEPGGCAQLMRGMVGSRRRAPGVTPLEPLLDVLVHGQDIALPLGIDRPMPTLAAVTAANRVWGMGWPFHARRRLAGLRLVATDADWTVGDGAIVEGPIRILLLLVTGRSAAVPQVTGEGAEGLAARLSAAVGG